MAASVYLITGSARGIGRGIVKQLLKRPNTIVFAGVRDTNAQAAIELKHFEVGAESKLILLTLDATKKSDNEAAVSVIKSYGISHVDVVIANAGVATEPHQTVDIPESDFLYAYQANTLGPIFLFQAVQPILSAAPNPRFFVSTSLIGSIGYADQLPVPVAAYGVSKAGITWFMRKMHGEFPNITFVPIHPGLVDTDMGGPFAKLAGLTPISIDESVAGYLKQIDSATRDTHGGKFIDNNGEPQPL